MWLAKGLTGSRPREDGASAGVVADRDAAGSTNADESLPSTAVGSTSRLVPPAIKPPQQVPIVTSRERRVMPHRLRRAAELLAGSTIGDEINGSLSKGDTANGLPDSTPVFFTTRDCPTAAVPYRAPEHFLPALEEPAENATSTSVGISARYRALIETPDFRELTDTEVMGKTRSLRSEEDTSDAAYERRHRRPDNVEKKQRRLEREYLEKDRQKVRERIEQLKHADTRTLMDIVLAREQRQRQQTDSANGAVSAMASTSSGNGTPGDDSSAATNDTARLEQLRHDLIAEAKALLRRYDALLPESDLGDLTLLGKRKKQPHSTDDAASTSTADDSDVMGPAARSNLAKGGRAGRAASLRVKRATNRGSPITTTGTAKGTGSRMRASASTGNLADVMPRKPNTKYVRASMSNSTSSRGGPSARRASTGTAAAAQSPTQPFAPSDGPVRAEHTYANIHARTSGGRFAPKAALAKLPGVPAGSPPSGSTSRINTKSRFGSSTKKSRGSVSNSRNAATTSPSPLPRGTLSSPAAAKRRPGRPRKDSNNDEAAYAQGGRTASGSGSRASTSRLPRLSAGKGAANTDEPRANFRVVLRRNASTNGKGSSMGSSPAPTLKGDPDSSPLSSRHGDSSVIVAGANGADNLEEEDDEEEDVKPVTAAALSAEEAQRLFAQAMADGNSEDGMDGDDVVMEEEDAEAVAAAIAP